MPGGDEHVGAEVEKFNSGGCPCGRHDAVDSGDGVGAAARL